MLWPGMYQIFSGIFPVRRPPNIITKFPNAENHTEGKSGLVLIISKEVSAEKIYLAETEREKKIRIPINSSAKS